MTKNSNRRSTLTTFRKEYIFPESDFHIAESSFSQTPSYHHDHDYYEILIVETGNLLHYVNDIPTPMHMDMLSLLFPEDRHYFKAVGNTSARLVNLAFSKEIFETACSARQAITMSLSSAPAYEITPKLSALPDGLASHACQSPRSCRALQIPRELSSQLQQRFWALQHTASPAQDAINRSLLISIVMDVLALIENPDTTIQNLPSWLEDACDAMRSQSNLVQGLPQFIQLCDKSQEHVTRAMQKHLKQTPTAYINMLRLEYVANQLTTTGHSILDIAMDAGFQNLSYFNKLFKEKYHLTPREYRMRSLTVLGIHELPKS